ncbi:dihydrolipoamide acetyltransferase family protein [Labrys neptuniae]
MAEVIDICVPPEHEGTKAIVANWLKKSGDEIAIDEPLVELETDKVTQEIPSPVAGVLSEIVLDTGEIAIPGAVLARVTIGEASSPSAEPRPTQTAVPAAAGDGAIRYSPAVRRAAEQYGIDPANIPGTGKGGRVTRADMETAFEERERATAKRTAEPQQTMTASAVSQPRPASAKASTLAGSRRVPHSPMRLAIAQHMANSVAAAPHVTAVFEADFSAIIRHRDHHKRRFAEDGINLSYTAYIAAACVPAMRAVPQVNSHWHDDALEIFGDVNIGIGTALDDKGLVVPVIHQVQDLALEGIARGLQDLTLRAREGKLSPADMRGGTFTISNHGVSGSLVATPVIINQPQSAILGVGALQKRAVVREIDGRDALVIRPMAYVSLTIDHRSLDGHQTNAWLSHFVKTLQEWPL